MNKLKLMYDVIRTMKDKETLKGTLKAEGTKDQAKLFGFENAFEKNFTTGQTKAKINTEVDCDGKKMKMENNLDFEMQGCRGHHGFMRHMHAPHGQPFQGAHPGGIREGLNKAAFVFGILNSIKLEERQDGAAVLSLALADIPEDLKKAVQEHIKQAREHHEGGHEGDPRNNHHNHNHHEFMKEFHTMEKTDFSLKIFVSKDNAVEKIRLELAGEQEEGKHTLNLKAELDLA